MKKLEANQTLYFVGTGNYHNRQGDVTVLKVGRKWADITGAYKGRIDVVTLQADAAGYSSPGRCYASRQEWLDQEGPRRAWQQLRSSMPMACPAGLALADIQQAAKLLGVPIQLPGQKEG